MYNLLNSQTTILIIGQTVPNFNGDGTEKPLQKGFGASSFNFPFYRIITNYIVKLLQR